MKAREPRLILTMRSEVLIPCVTLAAILQFPWLASGNVGGTVCIAIFYGFFRCACIRVYGP